MASTLPPSTWSGCQIHMPLPTGSAPLVYAGTTAAGAGVGGAGWGVGCGAAGVGAAVGATGGRTCGGGADDRRHGDEQDGGAGQLLAEPVGEALVEVTDRPPGAQPGGDGVSGELGAAATESGGHVVRGRTATGAPRVRRARSGTLLRRPRPKP